MGDPKLLARFREVCEAYKVEYALEGVIEGFDTVDTVPSERLTRGLFVRSEKGTRLIQLEHKRRPPVDIGDTAIVVGSHGTREENAVQPAVILYPTGRYVSFSRNIRTPTIGTAILWYTPVIICFGFMIMAPWIMPRIEYYLFSFLVTLLLLCWTCVVIFVPEHSGRPRSYHCDEQTWHALIAEVAEKFGIKTSV